MIFISLYLSITTYEHIPMGIKRQSDKKVTGECLLNYDSNRQFTV